jgi:two-component system sensor histidine kinase DegS
MNQRALRAGIMRSRIPLEPRVGPPARPRVPKPKTRRVPANHMIHVAIIGAGQGGTSLIRILHDDPLVTIVGVADLDSNAPGMLLARQLKIRTTTDYQRLLKLPKVDTIIDVSGSDDVADALLSFERPEAAVVGGPGAKFMWQLIDERIRSKEELERHLHEYQSLYRLYMKEVRHAISEERTRIALDIHDGLVQTLAGLSYKLDLCREFLALDPSRGARTLRETQHLLKGAIEEARQVVFSLKPLHFERLELRTALKHYAKTYAKQYRIATTVSVQGSERGLSPKTKIFLFRIVQEALSNVQKHAGASKVQVRVAIEKTRLTASIQDNGRGFDLPEVSANPEKWASLGLKGMTERARLLGGRARIETTPGQGTTISIAIPLKHQE